MECSIHAVFFCPSKRVKKYQVGGHLFGNRIPLFYFFSGHNSVRRCGAKFPTHSNILIPPFVLKQKVEPKIQDDFDSESPLSNFLYAKSSFGTVFLSAALGRRLCCVLSVNTAGAVPTLVVFMVKILLPGVGKALGNFHACKCR